jgi:peroxin-14
VDKTTQLVTQLQESTQSCLKSVQDQSAHVKEAIDKANASLQQYGDQEAARDTIIATVREELDRIKDTLPKMMDQQKESQNALLNELQQEVRSLKNLLGTRNSATASTLLAGITPGKPSIPAWQLATTSTATEPTKEAAPESQ